MAKSTNPGAPLTPEQMTLAKALARSISPSQADWLSGYFAGLSLSQTIRDPVAQLTSPSRQQCVSILYGTETGNSAEIARQMAEAAGTRGVNVSISDIADYTPRQLQHEQNVLLVVSTHGDGDPPQAAMSFFEYVEGRKPARLEGLRYAVLALGDSSYERYCEAGRRLDRRLAELGATRLADCTECDVDFEDTAAGWIDQMASLISNDRPLALAAASPAPTAGAGGTNHDRRSPFLAEVIDNQSIVGRGSSKEIRHVELSLAGSGLAYQPGDALGLLATNAPEVVESLLSVLGFDGERAIELKGRTCSLRHAFEHSLEITTATTRFLTHWGTLTNAKCLLALTKDEARETRIEFLRRHHIVDIVRKFPLTGVPPQEFISGLRPLQPRLYSIASSQSVVEDEAHLTVAHVHYALHGESRSGVASGQLARRTPPEGKVPVYIQTNDHFRLPQDDVPIVMIGAGTGVAPYRAFMQELYARGSASKCWLFFGERNFRTDFLYQAEWLDFRKRGLLTRMDVAFSRDQSCKTYVQHRMREHASDLYAWMEEGAHVYVCGDATRLAPDVHQALVDAVAQEGCLSQDQAEDYVHSLQAEHRYQRDVY
jgi:sulfite reductase (NADPH) flavoprotein alpha-component